MFIGSLINTYRINFQESLTTSLRMLFESLTPVPRFFANVEISFSFLCSFYCSKLYHIFYGVAESLFTFYIHQLQFFAFTPFLAGTSLSTQYLPELCMFTSIPQSFQSTLFFCYYYFSGLWDLYSKFSIPNTSTWRYTQRYQEPNMLLW